MTPGSQPELTMLVPVFNEEENLRVYLPVLQKIADACTQEYEILLVDDGSHDASAEVIEGYMKTNARVRLVRHPRNRGPGSAVPTGISQARGEWIALVPADLACDPEEIPRLWRARTGKELVVGLRSDRRDYPLWRKILSLVYIHTLRLATGSRARQFNYIQLWRRELVAGLDLKSRGVFVTAEIILRAERAGCRIGQLPMAYRPRTRGKALGASPRAMVRCLVDMTRYLASG
jgi:glycosyltransferase involved in cell wall biosynthesis